MNTGLFAHAAERQCAFVAIGCKTSSYSGSVASSVQWPRLAPLFLPYCCTLRNLVLGSTPSQGPPRPIYSPDALTGLARNAHSLDSNEDTPVNWLYCTYLHIVFAYSILYMLTHSS